MDSDVTSKLLEAIREAVSSTRQKDDDIALPQFNPEKSNTGAASWCRSIEALSNEFQWSSLRTAARAGKALRGSALIWFESWDPSEGRSWENLRTDIIDAYPEKKNLSEQLTKAILYTSDSAESYCEYARHKIRLLRNTKIAFTETQLIELVCGGISDVDVRMTSLNNGVTKTAALITLLSSYLKTKKRHVDHNESPTVPKRPKINVNKHCFICKQSGHFQRQCPQWAQVTPRVPKQMSNDYVVKNCTYCKRVGHTESTCYHKQRAETVRTITPASSVQENTFLGRQN